MENYELYKWFIQQSPIMQALYAGLFTWGLTAIGAALVFLFKTSNRKVLDISLGFTGGVMIAASFWSLLAPSIAYVEIQNEMGLSDSPSWFAPAVGFFLGAVFLFGLDKIIPHLHIFAKREEAEGELTIIKGIGNNSPEMKSLQAQVEELKKEMALVREDAQVEIMRRDERIKEAERINKLHQELNGKLQVELVRYRDGHDI